MNGQRLDFVADTSAIIRLLRGDAQVEEKVRGKSFAITFVTLAELSVGVLKANNPNAAWAKVVEVLRDRRMFRVSDRTPALYARIYYDLEQRGTMIPVNYIWIATLAIEAGLPMLARDEHFSRFIGLSVIEC